MHKTEFTKPKLIILQASERRVAWRFARQRAAQNFKQKTGRVHWHVRALLRLGLVRYDLEQCAMAQLGVEHALSALWAA
jgi:hypothetical protein